MAIFAARFSHDGQQVAVMTRTTNWKISVWDSSGGQLLFSIELPLDLLPPKDDGGDEVPKYNCDICFVDSARIAVATSASASSASSLALSETPRGTSQTLSRGQAIP